MKRGNDMCRKVILDTDPGIDDTLAIAVALASSELDVIAISTVYGNVSLAHTSENARLICDILEKDVPIYSGASKPLVKIKPDASAIHGSDGLGNLRDKYRNQVESLNTVTEGLYNTYNLIKNSTEKITIIAVGPLTNIATLLLFDPSIKDNIEEIQIMGGGINRGNVNELSEFNFFSDAEAVEIVLNSGIKSYIATLNCTEEVYITPSELALLPETNLKQKLIKEAVGFYASEDRNLHDVCSVLMVTHPHLFETKEVSMQVIKSNDKTDGLTYLSNTLDNNTNMMSTVKREEIIKYLIEVISNEYA